MRDDAHRTAPVPTRWKAAIRDCRHESEVAEAKAQHSVSEAVQSEIRQVGSDFVEAVREMLQSPTLPFCDGSLLSPVPRPLTAPERQIVDQLRIMGSRADALDAAYSAAIRETVESRLSQISGHLAAEDPRSKSVRMRALRAACNRELESLRPGDVSRRVARPRLDLDADLGSRRKS